MIMTFVAIKSSAEEKQMYLYGQIFIKSWREALRATLVGGDRKFSEGSGRPEKCIWAFLQS